ncbi:YciI family protein [uncultured Devosia sp.]|uniref:YciI family protein n=1 Tax=uncultured Devosia sp. TaxID=211434 RepID=UPI0035C95BFD
MHYAILCYNDENAVAAWTREEDDACMARLAEVEARMAAKGRLGPVARLQPTTAAATLRKTPTGAMIVDGPFAETKEQFLGFFVADCDTLDDAIAFAKDLAIAHPAVGAYEIRPLAIFKPNTITAGATSPRLAAVGAAE